MAEVRFRPIKNATYEPGSTKPVEFARGEVVVTLDGASKNTAPDPRRRQVSREEFEEWIASYPRKLDVDIYGIADPPWRNYHDFTIGKGWDSLVAGVHLCHEPERGEIGQRPDEYFIFVETVQ